MAQTTIILYRKETKNFLMITVDTTINQIGLHTVMLVIENANIQVGPIIACNLF